MQLREKMSNEHNRKVTVEFSLENLKRLKEAKALFEGDTEKNIELEDFVDMLVETFLSYRNARGATESTLLQKLKNNQS
jgi:hypothetical protein